MKFFLLTILFLNFDFTFDNPENHPIHVSVTNFELNKSNKEFNISFKFFLDDFQRNLNRNYNTNLNLKNETDLKKCNNNLNKYVFSNFIVIFNNKQIKKFKLYKKRVDSENNSFWVYYSFKYKKKINSVSLKNTILNDLYTDQKNLLIFTYKKYQKAITFTNKNTEEHFKPE